jgi:hypothetical protein
MIKTATLAICLSALLPSLSWPFVIGPFKSLSSLIEKSDLIAVVTVDHMPNPFEGATTIHILKNLKGNLKAGSSVQTNLMRLEFFREQDLSSRHSLRASYLRLRERLADILLPGRVHFGPPTQRLYDLYPSYSSPEDRRVVFLRKVQKERFRKESVLHPGFPQWPESRCEYESLTDSGNQFWVAPISDLSKLDASQVRSSIDTLVREALSYDAGKPWLLRDQRYADIAQIYLESK